MNIQATIESVSDKIKTWEGRGMSFIEGMFTDGSGWSNCVKDEYRERRHAELRAKIGQAGEFEVEPGKEYNGVKQWKLKSWPGREQRQAGGRGGSFQPRFRDTEEGAKQERDSIHRSVALQESVAFASTRNPEEVMKYGASTWILSLADQFYQWLSKGEPAPPVHQTAEANQPVGANTQVANHGKTPSEPPSAGGLACPNCGMNDSKIVLEARDKPGIYFCWKKRGGCGAEFTKMQALQKMVGATSGTEFGERPLIDRIKDEVGICVSKKDPDRLDKVVGRVRQLHQSGELPEDQYMSLGSVIADAEAALEVARRF